MSSNKVLTNTMSSSNVLDAYNLVGTDGHHQVLFLGGYTGNPENTNTTYDRNRISSEISVVKRIRRQDVVPVIQRVNWTSGSPYNFYNSRDGNRDDGSYAYYALASNNILYLCLSNNDKSRIDLSLQVNSTSEPTHTVGIQEYPDGYTWMALFKIDYTLSKFLSENWIPVPILENLFSEHNTSNNLNSFATDICGSSAGVVGACCLYNKEKKYDPITSIEITGGNLFDCFSSIPCYRCEELSQSLDKEKVFIQGATCASCEDSVEIKSLIEKIDGDSRDYAKNSTIITQRNIQGDSEENDGRILSAFIDLSGISTDNLVTTDKGTEIDLNNGGGTDAVVKLTTYPIFIDNTFKNVIDGIEVVNRGKGYHTVSPYVTPSSNSIDDVLSSRILVNVDTKGSLSKDLVEILNVNKLLTKVCLTSDEVEELSSKAAHGKFSRFGIIQNMKDSGGRVIGEGLNINESVLKSATYLVTATTSAAHTMRPGEQLSTDSGIAGLGADGAKYQNSGKLVGVDATGGTLHVLRVMTDGELSVGDELFVSIDPVTGGVPSTQKKITLTIVNEPDVDLDLTTAKVLHTGNTNINIIERSPRKEYCFEFVKVF